MLHLTLLWILGQMVYLNKISLQEVVSVLCMYNNLDALNDNASEGAEFLTKYFNNSKCEYSSVITARLTLLSILCSSNDNTFGKHPLMQRLLRGMFRLKPS